MTGFLQRLAQRANGSARTVRAASGTRFAPEPLGRGTPMPEDTPATEATAPFQPAGPTADTPPGTDLGRFSDPVFAPTDAWRQRAAEPPRQGQTTGTRSTPDPLLAPADETGAAPSPARAKTSMTTSRPPDPMDGTLAARGVNPGTGEPTTPRPDATPTTAAPGSSTASSTTEPPPWPQVEPLLAPTSRVRWPASAALPPQSHRPSQRGPADSTTEVHVSIGRIEVTAIHEPAAPAQRPAARRKAPVSLDEYLARRQGGRS